MTDVTMNYTVSQGTVKDIDLMMSMVYVLLTNLDADNPNCYTVLKSSTDYYTKYNKGIISSQESKEMDDFIWEYLWGLCESISPEGCYFGFRQGDSSLLGYWEHDLDNLF